MKLTEKAYSLWVTNMLFIHIVCIQYNKRRV